MLRMPDCGILIVLAAVALWATVAQGADSPIIRLPRSDLTRSRVARDHVGIAMGDGAVARRRQVDERLARPPVDHPELERWIDAVLGRAAVRHS